MTRKDFTQLPDIKELQDILATEAQRKLPVGKEKIHYPDFLLITELFDKFSLPFDIFSKDYDPKTLERYDLIEDGKRLIEQLKNKILSLKPSNQDIELFDKIYDYLSQQDKPKKADLIFVFGSKTLARIEKAIELYKNNFSELIVISGGNPIYEQDKEIPEAERYKSVALEKGVPEKDTIAETKSISIPDNVRSSLNLLDEKSVRFNSMILVNSPYSQRRGWCHFKKYLPDEIRLIRVNSNTIPQYERSNWYKNEDGISVIINEFVKMKVAVILNTA